MVRIRGALSSTEASGVRIVWSERGRGDETVVFVAGYLAGRQIWALQTARLVKDYRTVVYDRRGVGDSEHPEEGYGLGDNVEDLKAVIEAASPEAPVHLVGHSMGGFIAQGFALRYPERLRSLTLLATAPYRTAEADFGVGIFVNDERGPLRWDKEGLDRAVELLIPEPGFEWVRLSLRESMPRAMDPAQSVKTFRAFDGIDLRERLEEIRAPTLVLHGDADPVVPPEVGRALAEGIPGAAFHLLEGFGHLLMLTAAEEVTDELRGFLRTVDGG